MYVSVAQYQGNEGTDNLGWHIIQVLILSQYQTKMYIWIRCIRFQNQCYTYILAGIGSVRILFSAENTQRRGIIDNKHEKHAHKMINHVVIIKLMQVLHRIRLKPASDIVHYSAKFEQYHNASNKKNINKVYHAIHRVKSSAGQWLLDNFTITISMADTCED